MQGPRKERADTAARSRESYAKDLKRVLLTVQQDLSRESYAKDPEKSRADSAARSRENYMKDPEKSAADSTARSKQVMIRISKQVHS